MACGKGGYDWPKEATTTLIYLYEEHPCLYLPTNADYHNRNVRNKALQDITTNFNKKKLTNLSLDAIKKKIHGIRTQFLSELQKIKKSEVSGASVEQLYKPKLWCFELLRFLQQGTEIVSKGESNMQRSKNTSESSVFSQNYDSDCEIISEDDAEDLPEERDMFSPSPCSSTHIPIKKHENAYQKKNSRKRGKQEEISGLLTTAVATLEEMNKPDDNINTKHATFGRFVAEELLEIKEEDILDDVKQSIIEAIFAGKRRQRERAHAK